MRFRSDHDGHALAAIGIRPAHFDFHAKLRGQVSEPGRDGVISGMRTSEVMIYVDMAKAMADGIKFLLSDNKVILTTGVDGFLDRKYFKHVKIGDEYLVLTGDKWAAV